METDSREGIVKETAEAKSDGRRINEADFVCTIIWYCTQYMNYIILGIAEFMLVGVLAARSICPGIGVRSEKLAVLMRGYLQSMKVNLREIIHYIDESTLEKAKNEKVQKQESPSKMSKDVEESVDKMISNRMSKAYSEWKSNQDTQPFNENIEKEYQKLLETLSRNKRKCLRSIVMKYLPAEQRQKSFSIAWV